MGMGMPERCPAVNCQAPGGVMIVLVRCVAVMAAIIYIQNVSARADDYPSRPVTLIVPWAPAGAVDTVARIIAPKMSERLGKAVIIENRGGAGSTPATPPPAPAPPEGYTPGTAAAGARASRPRMNKHTP